LIEDGAGSGNRRARVSYTLTFGALQDGETEDDDGTPPETPKPAIICRDANHRRTGRAARPALIFQQGVK
jgi:hypothetical protein